MSMQIGKIWENTNLIGGLEHLDYFSIQLGIIIPTDELIFFRGVGISPTSNGFWALPR